MRRAAALLLLAGCAAPPPPDAATLVTLDGVAYPVRTIAAEPMAPMMVGAGGGPSLSHDATPALRIGGTPDTATALRVFAAHCGLAADLALTYGAYGDTVWRDPATGEVVLWTTCG